MGFITSNDFQGSFGQKEVDFKGTMYQRRDGLVLLPMEDIASAVQRVAIGILGTETLEYLKFANSSQLAPILYVLKGGDGKYTGGRKPIKGIFVANAIHGNIPEIEEFFGGNESPESILSSATLEVVKTVIADVKKSLGEGGYTKASLIVK